MGSVKEHTRTHMDLELFAPPSVIPYAHFFYIAPVRSWSTKL
jgi:hypothetical protein